MTKERAKRAIITVGALLIASSAWAAPIIIEDRAALAASLQAVGDRITAIHAVADRGDGEALSLRLDAIENEARLDAAVREYLLETTLLALARTRPSRESRVLLDRYRSRRVTIFIRLHEEHRGAIVPLYDLAAAANLTLRVWDTADAAEQVSSALHAATWGPADYLVAPTGLPLAAWQQGTLRAFDAIDLATLVSLKPELLSSQEQSRAFDPLLLSAATRLGDRELYGALITQGSVNHARKAIESVARLLTADEASRILIGATDRAEVASTAILELGTLARNQEVRAWLLNRLGSPSDGASAALALARIESNDVLTDIRSIIVGDSSELEKLRAALVLRLSRSPGAQSLRRELLSTKLESERLREALL